MSRLSRQDSKKPFHGREASTGTSFQSAEGRRFSGVRVSAGFPFSVKSAEGADDRDEAAGAEGDTAPDTGADGGTKAGRCVEEGAACTGRTEEGAAERTGAAPAGADEGKGGVCGAGEDVGEEGASVFLTDDAGTGTASSSSGSSRGSMARFRSRSSSPAEGSRLVRMRLWESSVICHAA